MDSFLASQNLVFSIAIMIMLMLAVLEGAMMLIGVGLSDVLDNLLPDFDVPDVEAEGLGPVTKAFSWLGFGGVPSIIVIVVFLLMFGSVGLMAQSLLNSSLGFYLPSLIAVPLALCLSLPLVRSTNRFLGRFLSNSETSAISRQGFVGNVATITIGEAKLGSPAEAKFTDEHGTTHYVMVEPIEDLSFQQGSTVLIIGPEDSSAVTFQVVAFETDPVL